jgi:hypothetical protein
MNPKPPYYRIYLLSVWQEQNRGPPEGITWRFRLEDSRTGRRQVFVDGTTLLAAVQAIAVMREDVREQKEEAGES